MRRFIHCAAAGALALTAGASELRQPVWAQPGPASTAEARRALVLAGAEAQRAQKRAELLDRQARASLRASDKATFGVAALATRIQQAEAALASADANLALVAGGRRELGVRLARESAPVAQLLAGLQTQVRRPPALQLLQPGTITDAVHLRAVLVAVEPQIRRRTAALRSEMTRARLLEQEAMRLAARQRELQSELMARRRELAALSAAERIKARRASGAADREAERAFAIGQSARDLATLVRRLDSAGVKTVASASAARSPGGGVSGAPERTAPYRLPVQGRPVIAPNSQRKGLTLEPRPGAMVVAPGAGRVAFAGPYRGFGTIVIVEHEGGWTSLVTGLAASSVVVGQAVVGGSPLGEAPLRDPRITVELRRSGIPVAASAFLK